MNFRLTIIPSGAVVSSAFCPNHTILSNFPSHTFVSVWENSGLSQFDLSAEKCKLAFYDEHKLKQAHKHEIT